MKKKKIPVFDIALGKKEKEYIKDCLDTSFIGQGKYVKTLEENLVTLLTVNMELQHKRHHSFTLACATIGLKMTKF